MVPQLPTPCKKTWGKECETNILPATPGIPPNITLLPDYPESFLKVCDCKCALVPLMEEINVSHHISYHFPNYIIRQHKALYCFINVPY